jgi:hypothetical protein
MLHADLPDGIRSISVARNAEYSDRPSDHTSSIMHYAQMHFQPCRTIQVFCNVVYYREEINTNHMRRAR